MSTRLGKPNTKPHPLDTVGPFQPSLERVDNFHSFWRALPATKHFFAHPGICCLMAGPIPA